MHGLSFSRKLKFDRNRNHATVILGIHVQLYNVDLFSIATNTPLFPQVCSDPCQNELVAFAENWFVYQKTVEELANFLWISFTLPEVNQTLNYVCSFFASSGNVLAQSSNLPEVNKNLFFFFITSLPCLSFTRNRLNFTHSAQVSECLL